MKFLNLLKTRAGTGQMSSEQMPGHPQGDTTALVPVVALTEDMLVTRDGGQVTCRYRISDDGAFRAP